MITKMMGTDNAFSLTDGKSYLYFYLKNCDFPREYCKKSRGEIFLLKVSEPDRRKGKGLSMCRRVLEYMKSHGTKTVNMSPTSVGGKGVITSLIHNGDISFPIKQSSSGKMEFKIL